MARPSNYLGANLTLQDTFSSVIERSNDIAYDLGTIVVTTAPVPQANTTNGALTSGNAHIQGFFSANTLIASDELRGGSHDTPAELLVTSNTHFTGDRVYTSDTTIADFGANVTFSSDTANNLTNHFVVDFGNTHITQGELRVSGNTIFDNSAAVVDIDTNLVDVTANVHVQSAFVSMNVDTVTIGSDSTDDLTVNSNTVFNSDVLVGADATTLLEVNSNTVINNNVLIGEDESDLLEINANTVINNDAYIGSDGTDQLTVNSTSTFNNNVTLGSDGTDDLIVNADSDFNANVNVDGVLTTTNNATIGSDGTDTLTVNAASEFNANVNVDGVLTATNNATLGSDGTDTLTVNAASDFNANVNVDGVLTATNNATIGSDGTDTLTVNAATNLNANVTIGDAEADALEVNSTATFNNGVTIGSDETDDLLVNSNTGFVNDVTIGAGGTGTDTLTVNADSDFNANVNVDGVFSVTNNATIGSSAADQFTVNANTGFENDVTIGSGSTDSLTVQSTASFNNDLTVGSDATDQFTVNANTDFENDVTIGVDGTDILTVNAVSDFNANVSIDGELVVGNTNVSGDVNVTQTLSVTGETTFTSNTVITGTHKPSANSTHDLGATGAYFNDIYVDNFVSPNFTITNLNDTPATSPGTGEILVANSTGGFEYNTVATKVTELADTPTTVTDGSVLVGNTTNGFEYSPYIDRLIDLVDVLDNAPSNSHVLAYIEDSDGFEFRSPQSLSEDFSLTLDDLTDVDATTVAAGHIVVANTSLQWESKKLELNLITDVDTASTTGDVLVANSIGGFEFTSPSNLSVELSDLTDVSTVGAANSEVLTYIAATDTFEFTAYGWVLGNSQNATTGETITNAENVNIYGGSNITVSVGTGPLGQTNVQISQDDVVLGVNDLTDAVSYDGGISIGVGTGALVNDDDTINYNTAFGYEALNSVTTGTGNLGVGANAGDNIVNGFNNTVIGRGARASASDASNEITLGNNSVTDFRIPGIGLTANTTAIEFSGGTIATQSYVSTSVSSAIDNLIDSAPGTLDTLNELATALGDDPNFATTITNSLATKATLDTDVSFANVAMESLIANTISTTSAVVGQTITSTAGLLNLNGWEIDANLFDTTQTIIYADATHQFVGNVEIGDTLDVSNNTTIDGDLIVTRDVQMDTANVASMSANTLVVTQIIDGQVNNISNHDTGDLTEGTNLYYTVARANTAIDARVDKTFVDALNVDAETLDGANSTFYLDYDNFTGTPYIPQSTVDFDPVGTDNSTDVTLTGAYDYLTITGQQITLNQVDYTTDISNLPTLYTTADANNDIDARVTKSFVDALNVDADTLDGADSSVFLRNDQSGTVNGDLTVTGNIEATDFNSTSDARIKENVETVDRALDKVCSMRGVYYNRIGEVEQQIGVIAQEVEAIIPEVVQTGSNDIKTVSYGNLVGVLIEAIKDLRAEIDELKKNQ